MKEVKNGCILKCTIETTKETRSSEILCENLEVAKELFDINVTSNLRSLDLEDVNWFTMVIDDGIFKFNDKRNKIKYSYSIIENVDYSY